jgi:hypothetical protein
MAQAMPSSASLPSDYALISRYAAARGSPEASRAQNEEYGTGYTSSSLTAARTHTPSIGRPIPVMPAGQQDSEATKKSHEPEWRIALPEDEENSVLATETTPLIHSHGRDGYHESEDSDWRQELKILGRYTAPVFA